MLNFIKKLLFYSLIGGLISMPTAILSSGYSAEMSSNQKEANTESKQITHQHKLLESDIKTTAKDEHKDVTNTTNQKLDQVRQTYANSKDRSAATKKIKEAANNFHKEIDSRKKKHLAASADLKQSHLQESSDRHDRQADQIKAAYGKTIKTKKAKSAKSDKLKTVTPTTDNSDSLQVRSQRNAQRRARQACRENREENEQAKQAQAEQRKAEKKQALADQRAAKKADSDGKKADRDAKKAADKARAKANREAKANKTKAKKSNNAVDSYGDNY